MRSAAHALCGFIPPHILRHIAERGDDAQRIAARATLEASARLRGERATFSLVSQMIAVSVGEKRRTIFDAQQSRSLPGIRVRGEGEAKSDDAAVNEAYDGSGKTYDFYARVLGRNSIDGRGMRLDSTVHYGRSFSNAQWNGRQMIYGDGDGKLFNRFTKSLDVIAHELTHGVTQLTANLEYYEQSGALNEHVSDVFGSLVRQYSLKQTASEADWLIGRGLFSRSVQGEAVRSMKAPGTAYDDKVLGTDPQPAHMDDYLVTEEDDGGVHVNSGIPNHAFYQAATLLGGNAWEIAGRIWYRALTRKLHRNSDFQHCAGATFQCAGELYGSGSEPQKAVIAAWKAVGIDLSPALLEEGARLGARGIPAIDVPGGAAEVPADARLRRRRVVSA